MTIVKKAPPRTATKRKRPAKAATSPATAPKTISRARAAAAPKPEGAAGATATVEALRKKDLIDAVVERSEIKKKDAKPVVEAMLGILGEAVSEGRELNLHPLGKLKVSRSKDLPNGKMSICRIRQSVAADG